MTVPAADEHLRDCAHYITEREGGLGAVRELCDLILDAQGQTARILAELSR